VEELDGGAVVYDPHNGAVHHFNATTFLVWSACDGSLAPNDIAACVGERYSMGEHEAFTVVGSAVAQVCDKGLLCDRCDAPNGTSDRAKPVSEVGYIDAPAQPRVGESSRTTSRPCMTAETGVPAPSRREILGGGVTKAVLAAPVISTFFAAGAYASGPSASAAYGAGGCKTVGYSCTINSDCCEGGTTTACQDEGGATKTCCVQHNRSGCEEDADCCNLTDQCIAGFCG